MLASSRCDTEVGGAHPATEERDRRGETLGGKYELLHKIGEGSMGEVYEALHLALERRFAVKLLRGEHLASERMVLRFMLEMRAAGSLESSHIVPAIDCGHSRDGAPYYVMELLRGEDLGRILKRERQLGVARAVRLTIDVCHGLEAAHARGLVHRDLKPQNVFVVQGERGEELAKILDFGLVRLDRANTSAPAASLLGTVRYMAPEQMRNPALVDARADVYALGAVLYECLAGVPAHQGDTTEQILKRRLNEDPRSLGELRAALPRGLDGVVRRAFARNRNARFASAREFAAALERYLPAAAARELEPHSTRGPSTPPVAIPNRDHAVSERPALRSWLPHALGAFAATGVAIGALWFAGGAHDDHLQAHAALEPGARTDDALATPAAMTRAPTRAVAATPAVALSVPVPSTPEPAPVHSPPNVQNHALKPKVPPPTAAGQAPTRQLPRPGAASPPVAAAVAARATKGTGRPLDHENPYLSFESTR